MAANDPQFEWFLARDGAQHGPLSDVEMRKFAELGHLRPADLIWRAGFSDWRPSGQVLPELLPPRQQTAAAQSVSAPASRPQATSAPSEKRESAARAADRQPSEPSPAAATAAAPRRPATATNAELTVPDKRRAAGQYGAEPQMPAAQPRIEPEPQGRPDLARGATDIRQGPAVPGRLKRTMAGTLADQVQPSGLAPGSDPALKKDPVLSQRSRQQDDSIRWPDPVPEPDVAPVARRTVSPAGRGATSGSDRDEEARPRRSIMRPAAIAASVLILSGLGWIGWQNRSMLPGMSAIGGVMLARLTTAPSAELYQAAPFVAAGESRDDIDAGLQRTALWRLLKRDYPDWYAERLSDIERMRQQKADEKAVSKFLADVVVVQRRKSATLALAASPEHLKQMAGAFLDNLKQLAARDAQTCFGFISFGEASAYMLELSKTTTFAEPLQRQLTSVFEAIADGRKLPKFYAATRRTDYDVLTAELTARGWTQEDLATFSDARKLSSSPPDKVCRMVQDWFTVQLSLKDPELQGRLLAESLKPLVQG